MAFLVETAHADWQRWRRNQALPFANPSALSFACAFPIARTEAGPTGQMFGILKLIHVQPDFGEDAPSTHPINAGNRAEPTDCVLKRAQPLGDLLFQPSHFGFDEFQVIHQLLQQEAMMGRHTPFQGLLELRNLSSQQTTRHVGQLFHILLARNDGFQHRSSRCYQSVRCHRSELNVGIFEHLLNPIRDAVTFLRQVDPIAREVRENRNDYRSRRKSSYMNAPIGFNME